MAGDPCVDMSLQDYPCVGKSSFGLLPEQSCPGTDGFEMSDKAGPLANKSYYGKSGDEDPCVEKSTVDYLFIGKSDLHHLHQQSSLGTDEIQGSDKVEIKLNSDQKIIYVDIQIGLLANKSNTGEFAGKSDHGNSAAAANLNRKGIDNSDKVLDDKSGDRGIYVGKSGCYDRSAGKSFVDTNEMKNRNKVKVLHLKINVNINLL